MVSREGSYCTVISILLYYTILYYDICIFIFLIFPLVFDYCTIHRTIETLPMEDNDNVNNEDNEEEEEDGRYTDQRQRQQPTYWRRSSVDSAYDSLAEERR